MSKYKKSDVNKGETRNCTLTFIVENGASWAINNTKLSAEWIEKIEEMLVELAEDTRGGSK